MICPFEGEEEQGDEIVDNGLHYVAYKTGVYGFSVLGIHVGLLSWQPCLMTGCNYFIIALFVVYAIGDFHMLWKWIFMVAYW